MPSQSSPVSHLEIGDMSSFQDLVADRDLPAILLALAVIIISAVLLKRALGGQKGNVVLLLGAAGSGKTTLFYQLRDGTTHKGTVPSMQHNADIVHLSCEKENSAKNAKGVELIDVPGHPRLRSTAATFYGRARRIVFLVDAVEFMGQKTNVAEQLYEVLSDTTVQKQRTPVLLLCNKSDLGVKAHTSEFVRKRLEKEIEALRGTRSTLGEAGAKDLSLARNGEPFTFAGVRSPKLSVGSGSALSGDLQELYAFLK